MLWVHTLLKNHIPIVIALGVLTILFLLSLLDVIPNADELLSILSEKYGKYGLLALFVSTFIEGFLFVGMYYIGSIFIISSVILADGDVVTLIQLILTVWLALSLISVVNFTIGRRTTIQFKRPEAVDNERSEAWRKFIYFVHPTLVAYYAYSLGNAKKSYRSLIHVSIGVLISGVIFATLITVVSSYTSDFLTFVVMTSIFGFLVVLSRLG